MLDETTRKAIERKLESGELPLAAPQSIWGGKSSGRDCVGCDRRIEPDQLEMETVAADRLSRFYHPECLTYASEVRGRLLARANGEGPR